MVKVPLMPLEAVVDCFGLLPKESWLSSFCKAEQARGRRTLVYVRQTGTRDIHDRLESVLKQSGVQAITRNNPAATAYYGAYHAAFIADPALPAKCQQMHFTGYLIAVPIYPVLKALNKPVQEAVLVAAS